MSGGLAMIALPLLVGLLARVAGEGHRSLAVRVAELEELLKLAVLAVGEGVHRVDDDGLYTPAGTPSQDVVDDRDDVGEALARARAGGEDVVVPCAGSPDRLGLVAVKPEGIAALVQVLTNYLKRDKRC